MKVLVTGAGSVLGQAIIKSVKKTNKDIKIIAVDPNPFAVGLFWADKHYLVPMVSDSDYNNEIYKILELEKVDLLLVGTDVELFFYAKFQKEIEDKFGTKVIVSDSKIIEIANDKWLTYMFLKNNGFDFPESCLPSYENELISKVGFPLIVKPRVGARSFGVIKVNNQSQLIEALKKTVNPIMQEYVGTDNSEYTAGVVMFDKSQKASIVMRRDLKDGNTFRAYTMSYSSFNEYVEAVAEELNTFGPVNFQFRVVEEKVKIFEINARFSGTTYFRALSNFNEVEMCLNHVLNNEEIQQPQIKLITILRYYEEMIIPSSMPNL